MPELHEIASQVRRDILRMVHGSNSGHPGGSLGCADFLTALYFHTMKHRPESFDMDAREQDVFVLSNGHISPVFYSVLARSGYFPVAEMATFRKLDSRLQGHPTTHEGLPGVRIASGSLGQGMSVAIGAALAKKLNNDQTVVYSLHGDGELQRSLVGKGKPIAIIMHTIMGSGVDFMENDHNWHGVAPSDEQLEKALAQLPETMGDY
ncbi:MAG: hypothetical protein EOO08_07835 [Chitinophagaceae bacterium]|nr:MAG: hypothetical protein EOO08_07835 [Chitinophagaceae bacterium]